METETTLTLIESLYSIPFIGTYLPIITAVITLASAIAAVTPTPTKGWAAKLYKIIDLLAINLGKAKD